MDPNRYGYYRPLAGSLRRWTDPADPRAAECPVQAGSLIELRNMPDDPNPIPVGTRGTVRTAVRVGDEWHISVDWENGRTLSVLHPFDSFVVLSRPALPF